MKTKLLKKIRKRYTITYYSKQLDIYGTTFFGECMVLFDKDDDWRCSRGVEIGDPKRYPSNEEPFFTKFASTKEEAKRILIEHLIHWIKEDYRNTRTRKPNQLVETIWYDK